MGFYEDSSSSPGLTIGQAIYEAALIITLLRWILCFLFSLIKDRTTHPSSSSPPSSVSSHAIRDNTLLLSTFGDIVDRFPETEETCAVCLNHMKAEEEVRELMNCYHVFHRECIDRWLDHHNDGGNDDDDNNNNHPTCPLCRAPLLTPHGGCSSSSSCVPHPPQPSWAVERLLYLFGDDLLLVN